MLELIYAATLGQGALIVVLVLSARQSNIKANLFLLLLLLLMLKTVYVGYARLKGWDTTFLERYGIYPLFLHGPFVYLYCSIMVSKTRNWNIELLHFLWLLFPLFWIQFELYQVDWGLTLLSLVSFLQLTGYYLMSTLKIRGYRHSLNENFANTEKYKLRWLYSLVTGLGTLMTIDLGLSLLGRVAYQDASHFQIPYLFLLECGYVFALGIFAAKQPQIIFDFPLLDKSSRKYDRSGLSFAGAQTLLEKTLRHVSDKKRFLDNELSLAKLSSELNEIPQHLSQALNENLGKSFYDFINELRINECKAQLSNPNSLSKNLLDIAFDCGFNNKSSFNTAFKKYTGMTPSEFRRKNRETVIA